MTVHESHEVHAVTMNIKHAVRPMDPQLVDDFLGISLPTIGHYLESGFMDPAIRALSTRRQVAGRAVTVRMAVGDSTLVHVATAMLQARDVLVIVTGSDDRHAPVGAVVAWAARCAGASAIVVDGVCTDIVQITEMDFPVYARGTSLLTTKLRGLDVGAINESVSCGGVVVNPGDLICADANGVLVLPPEIAASLVATAKAADEEEPALLSRIAAGEHLPDISEANALLARLGRGAHSDGSDRDDGSSPS